MYKLSATPPNRPQHLQQHWQAAAQQLQCHPKNWWQLLTWPALSATPRTCPSAESPASAQQLRRTLPNVRWVVLIVLFVRLSLSVGTWPLTLSGHSASGWPSPSSALTGSRWASCCARPSDRAAWSPTFRKKKVWRLLGQGGVCGGQLLGVEDRFELQDPGHHVGGGHGAGGHQDRGTREREGRDFFVYLSQIVSINKLIIYFSFRWCYPNTLWMRKPQPSGSAHEFWTVLSDSPRQCRYLVAVLQLAAAADGLHSPAPSANPHCGGQSRISNWWCWALSFLKTNEVLAFGLLTGRLVSDQSDDSRLFCINALKLFCH